MFKAKRLRWFTRGLVLGALALMAGLALSRVQQQAASRELIEKLGGKTVCDPHWLSGFNLASLRLQKGLDRVEFLDLNETALQDEDLPKLAGCRGVRQVTVSSTKITNQGLAEIPWLAKLTRLDIGNTAIDDVGLQCLPRCEQLQAVGLSKLTIGPGLRHLAGCPQLQVVVLRNSSVGDEEVGWLRGLELVELDLSGTAVTDSGLTHLTGLRRLSKLELAQTAVTDDGLKALAQLPSLTSLDVSHSRVTAEGVKSFLASRSERLPPLEVHRRCCLPATMLPPAQLTKSVRLTSPTL